jgi:hypothetical protein
MTVGVVAFRATSSCQGRYLPFTDPRAIMALIFTKQ